MMYCPNCKSKEFMSELNQYDILEFIDGDFRIIRTESVDEYRIFCRECGREVSNKNGQIIIKEQKSCKD